ncbi:uncharacterized protein LOC106059872 [Biomphalaria glabrata]|uniref:Uncharacterized protein LOC106059872 n=1 Tax=Biomphalaria glabrata TaxID=6526 RepID=A0A9W2Z7J8_BIOGL|nr:uncharacterized protein LOC106059872 [Biomphalaria glabrata]XP_055870891.1 uncharacterized protein LOC106059872 [Biomphalaria glabrata]
MFSLLWVFKMAGWVSLCSIQLCASSYKSDVPEILAFSVTTFKSICRSSNYVVLDRGDYLKFQIIILSKRIDFSMLPWRIIVYFNSSLFDGVNTVGAILPLYNDGKDGEFAIGTYYYTEYLLGAELNQQALMKYNQSTFYTTLAYADQRITSKEVPAPTILRKEIEVLYVNGNVVPVDNEVVFISLWGITTITYCVYNIQRQTIHMYLDGINYYSNTSCARVLFKAVEKFSGIGLFTQVEELDDACQRRIFHNYILSLDPDSMKFAGDFVLKNDMLDVDDNDSVILEVVGIKFLKSLGKLIDEPVELGAHSVDTDLFEVMMRLALAFLLYACQTQ